jgi:aconitate hydratase
MNSLPHFTTECRLEDVSARVVDLPAAAEGRLRDMPVIHRILLENVVRCGRPDAQNARRALLGWLDRRASTAEIPFLPGRILMHDTTCGPALVDIAAMRSVVAEAGGDPHRLRPVLPVDVSTDHSLAVDVFGVSDAARRNMAREMERNAERYRFMKWASQALGIRVHPPGTGIMHTLNLERLATVVTTESRDGTVWAVPDTLIGTDSHTPMINGIGVLGWGVGGIEAEAVMFGAPLTLRVPDVVGVRLTGALSEGVLATDLALSMTSRLRQINLADRYVEFFGPGVTDLSAGDRAVVANMTPEFGANTGYFPIDSATLSYLRKTGRPESQIRLVENYARRNGLWHEASDEPIYAEVVDVDLFSVRPSLAGPRRPQDRIEVSGTRAALGISSEAAPVSEGLPRAPVAIAAITSCTNTSDPRLLIAAGLVARKARAFGLRPPHWVKTSLAPGSPAAERLLKRAALLEDLEAVGFGIVGYGCTTCIGNSGPLTEPIAAAISSASRRPVAILSGNRNFPGRVHPDLELGFLASPPMVVAFALAGDADRDLTCDPVARQQDGRNFYLKDLWPSSAEIDAELQRSIDTADVAVAAHASEDSELWALLATPSAELWPWEQRSTYLRRPPFADAATTQFGPISASPLLVLGDDMTTDHISPAGQIPAASSAATHLRDRGVDARDINVFAAYRGNWEVMIRGLFTNKSVINRLAPDLPPGQTIHATSGRTLPLWQAAQAYTLEGRATVVIAGERYGMGSSRDWAAKGVALLGVKAVLANSFERIHRTNLIGMGVVPVLLPGDAMVDDISVNSTLALDLADAIVQPRAMVSVVHRRAGKPDERIDCVAAIETSGEVETLRCGGFIPAIVKRALDD